MTLVKDAFVLVELVELIDIAQFLLPLDDEFKS